MRLLCAACAGLALTSVAFAAQHEAPPPGTLATIHESHAQDARGDRRDHVSTTYRDSTGVTKDSKTTSVTAAPPPVTSTTSSETTTTTTPR